MKKITKLFILMIMAFMSISLFSCTEQTKKVSVIVPTGTPSLAETHTTKYIIISCTVTGVPLKTVR